MDQLTQLFTNPSALMDQLPHESAETLSEIIQRAKLAATALKGTLSAQRDVLTTWVAQIIVGDGTLALTVKLSDDHHTILKCRIAKIRSGVDVKLRVDPESIGGNAKCDDQLVTLLGEAHTARSAVIAAPDQTLYVLATTMGTALPRFKRLIRLSYLSPKIVEMVLEGKQPKDLTFARLNTLSHAPLDWHAQHALFGVA